MSKFNLKENVGTVQNLAGGRAFTVGADQQLASAVLCSFLEDKFYESGSERIERIALLVPQCSPEFVASLASYARKRCNMRSATTVLLGEMAKSFSGVSIVNEAITSAITRVDDATELAAYLKGKLTKQAKRGLRNAILKFDRHQLAKYRAEGKSVSLIDLFNLTHPKVQHANEEQKGAWKDLMTGKLRSEGTWEVEISAAKDETAKRMAWESLILEDKLGYMALLRNLRNISEACVSETAMKSVIAKLTDPEQVAKSKQLPHRFHDAAKNAGDRNFVDAVVDAADIALSNVPEFGGKLLVAVDVSSSMRRAITRAALFAATLVKSNPNAELVLYDTDIRKMGGQWYSSNNPILTLAENIIGDVSGGGTDTSLVFKYAAGKGFDDIIILSDNQSWADDAQAAYRKMKSKPKEVFCIDIQGYGTVDVKGGNVHHLCGWSNDVLNMIQRIRKGGDLVSEIMEFGWQKPVSSSVDED